MKDSPLQNIECKLSNIWHIFCRWWHTNRSLFLSTLLIAAAVHYVYYANHLQNYDSLLIGKLYTADLWERIPYWETAQGRWALRIVDTLRGGINLAPLSDFLMLACYTLAGVLLNGLFQLKSRPAQVLVPMTVVCVPFVAEIETYHYCNAAYATSFLLAIGAVYFAVYASPLCGWVMGTACLMFSLGMYQAHLGVSMVLCLFLLILQLLREPKRLRNAGYMLVRMLAMGVGGTAGYCVALKLFLRLYDTSLSGINGINLVGNGSLQDIFAGIARAYADFHNYFFIQHGIAQNYYGQRAGYLLLLFLAVGTLLYLLWQNHTHPVVCTASLILLALVPAAANITDIINPNTQIVLRTAGAMTLVVPFLVALIDTMPRAQKRSFPWAMAACTGCCAVLLRGYILQTNNDAMVLLVQKNKLVSLANRICMQLEQNVDYQTGSKVTILGRPQLGTYDEVSALNDRASDLVQFEALSYDPTFNSYGWHNLYWETLSIRMNWCSDEETRAVCATEEFQSMPIYPADGSIAVIDGIVVVKVSEIQ